jgi:hypothetical protein
LYRYIAAAIEPVPVDVEYEYSYTQPASFNGMMDDAMEHSSGDGRDTPDSETFQFQFQPSPSPSPSSGPGFFFHPGLGGRHSTEGGVGGQQQQQQQQQRGGMPQRVCRQRWIAGGGALAVLNLELNDVGSEGIAAVASALEPRWCAGSPPDAHAGGGLYKL